MKLDDLDTTHKNWVKKTNDNLDLILDESMFINCLRFQWIDNEDITSIEERRDPKKIAPTAVEVFSYYLELGIIPPPEILLTIHSMFSTYFTHRGALSLDDIFFGKPKRGVGNYAAQSAHRLGPYAQFHSHMSMPKAKSSGKSMEEHASDFFIEQSEWHQKLGLDYSSPDVDTFLRQYRRWRKRKSDEKSADT